MYMSVSSYLSGFGKDDVNVSMKTCTSHFNQQLKHIYVYIDEIWALPPSYSTCSQIINDWNLSRKQINQFKDAFSAINHVIKFFLLNYLAIFIEYMECYMDGMIVKIQPCNEDNILSTVCWSQYDHATLCQLYGQINSSTRFGTVTPEVPTSPQPHTNRCRLPTINEWGVPILL